MKKLKAILVLLFCLGFLFGSTSCAVFFTKDNGKHKGWYKNTNNPHNPNYMDQGKSNNRQKK
jgi:hypothetical protein